MGVGVILPAAGASQRFGAAAGTSKVEADLGGRPVFLRALEPFLERADVAGIVLAVAPEALESFKARWGPQLAFRGVELRTGASEGRAETVRRGLDALPSDCDRVAVHDAARPLVTGDLVERVWSCAARHGAAVPGVPVAGTLKRAQPENRVDGAEAESDALDALLGPDGDAPPSGRFVHETIDRTDLYEIQTPQLFDRRVLARAYEHVAARGIGVTDDAGAVEGLGEPVALAEGERRNLKITTPEDLELARALLRAK